MNKEGDEVRLVGTLVTMIELAQRTRRAQEDRAGRETAPAAEADGRFDSSTADIRAAAASAPDVTKPHSRLVASAATLSFSVIALAMAIVVAAAAAMQ